MKFIFGRHFFFYIFIFRSDCVTAFCYYFFFCPWHDRRQRVNYPIFIPLPLFFVFFFFFYDDDVQFITRENSILNSERNGGQTLLVYTFLRVFIFFYFRKFINAQKFNTRLTFSSTIVWSVSQLKVWSGVLRNSAVFRKNHCKLFEY